MEIGPNIKPITLINIVIIGVHIQPKVILTVCHVITILFREVNKKVMCEIIDELRKEVTLWQEYKLRIN